MEKVTLNNKEQRRLIVMNEVLAGRLTGAEAAQMLGVSLRHTRRLLAAYRRQGAAALAPAMVPRRALPGLTPSRLLTILGATLGGLPPSVLNGHNSHRRSSYGDIFPEQLAVTLSLNTDRLSTVYEIFLPGPDR